MVEIVNITGTTPPDGPSEAPPKIEPNPHDVLSARLTQAGAILHMLRAALSDDSESIPSNRVISDTCWAVNELLDQAETAAEKIAELEKKGTVKNGPFET